MSPLLLHKNVLNCILSNQCPTNVFENKDRLFHIELCCVEFEIIARKTGWSYTLDHAVYDIISFRMVA